MLHLLQELHFGVHRSGELMSEVRELVGRDDTWHQLLAALFSDLNQLLRQISQLEETLRTRDHLHQQEVNCFITTKPPIRGIVYTTHYLSGRKQKGSGFVFVFLYVKWIEEFSKLICTVTQAFSTILSQ